VACVTPVRRLAGREVTTLEGLDADLRDRWAAALLDTGGSQCGFCTPGIVMRLAADSAGRRSAVEGSDRARRALGAHLCRCTGWQTVVEAAASLERDDAPTAPVAGRDLAAASARASLEGGAVQRVGTATVLGEGGFADDTCPPDALVAVPDGEGGYAVGETLTEARRAGGQIQGRNIPAALHHPLSVPPGAWELTLQTTWVEPAYLETDASWCVPGGEPAPPCANGGAFGGKRRTPVTGVARRLADELGRPVRVRWSREDVVRLGPKRPPVAAGIDADGHGVLRVGVDLGVVDPDDWEAVVAQVATVSPGLLVEPVAVDGPPVSLDLRAAVWAEAAVLAAAARRLEGSGRPTGAGPVEVDLVTPAGARAAVCWQPPGDAIDVEVEAGSPLDEIVLRSYCIGAVHQALGWVLSEGVAVDDQGVVRDLTIRSFGILPARAVPEVTVRVRASDAPPVNGSDAVFAATAAACWIGRGLVPTWPIERGGAGR
jgi:hypothetical protein